MAVKIWDASVGAFKDAETPMIWDEQAQAWKDSAGFVYNQELNAWNERWSGKKWLYHNGTLNLIAGNFKNTSYGSSGYSSASNGMHASTPIFNDASDYFKISMSDVAGMGTLFFTNAIDLTDVKTVYVKSEAAGESTVFGITDKIIDNYSFAKITPNFVAPSSLDVSDLSGKYYFGFRLSKSYTDMRNGINPCLTVYEIWLE
nr:MAG TPA: hypothetical protein [Caudoviricetes sp.]